MNDAFAVIPAIDLRNGRVVRLHQGDYAKQTQYDIEPVALARSYAEVGARWLHVVDLDGARGGHPAHLDLIVELSRTGMRIQAGGGVRTEEDIGRLREAGVERVVIGSLAVLDPARVIEWLQSFGGESLTVALDTRRRDGAWRLATDGWSRDGETTLEVLASRYAACGARHMLCTDIDRDGTLSGPNLSLLETLRSVAPALAVQISGGVRCVNDVRAAREAGAGGIVLGRALLENRFGLLEALSC